ncbi:MAG: hypothetical protein ACHQNA_03710 [Acidimicrobiales bacterium]
MDTGAPNDVAVSKGRNNMAALVILVLISGVATVWGADSRRSDDPRDRYWWPNG